MMRSRLRRLLVQLAFLLRDTLRVIRRRVRVFLLHHRYSGLRYAAQSFPRIRAPQRVVAVVTHVLSTEDSLDPVRQRAKLECLASTIDSLCSSLAHHEVKIVISTYRGRSIGDRLPAYQRDRCEVREHDTGDPMFLEFAAQDLFLENCEYDWFLFLEDDLSLVDSCFLEKLAAFNRAAAGEDALLIPHRFEMKGGCKYYIDRDAANRGWGSPEAAAAEDVINPVTIREVEGINGTPIKFAEYTNPHGACYCLSRPQLERWQQRGGTWQGKISWIGPLESAATGCLFEAFDLYKPHPDNKWYLEIRHHGTKYSDRFIAAESAASSLPQSPRGPDDRAAIA